MKYAYNKTKIYTLLFKQGNMEIKAGSYLEVTDEQIDTGMFNDAINSGQLKIYESKDQIPENEVSTDKKNIITNVSLPGGLTADELKEKLEKEPIKPRDPSGKTTQLGSQDSVESEPRKDESTASKENLQPVQSEVKEENVSKADKRTKKAS